jgi:hypothetical protein
MYQEKTSYSFSKRETPLLSFPIVSRVYSYGSFPNKYSTPIYMSKYPTIIPSKIVVTRCPSIPNNTIEPNHNPDNNTVINDVFIISISFSVVFVFIFAILLYKFYYLKHKKQIRLQNLSRNRNISIVFEDDDFGLTYNDLRY